MGCMGDGHRHHPTSQMMWCLKNRYFCPNDCTSGCARRALNESEVAKLEGKEPD